MLFTDGEVVMSFADEHSAGQHGFRNRLDADEIAQDFIEWYAEPYEFAEDGNKIYEFASDYAECINYWLVYYADITMQFARTAFDELWETIARKMDKDSRFRKVTTFVYAK